MWFGPRSVTLVEKSYKLLKPYETNSTGPEEIPEGLWTYKLFTLDVIVDYTLITLLATQI